MEELDCHTVGIEEQDGDVVLACARDGESIPMEMEGGAGKGMDGGGQGFYGSSTQDESGEVVLEAMGGGFDQGIVIFACGDVHFGNVGCETMESQRDDGSDDAHDFHYEGEAGTVFELPLGAAVVIMGGHGTHAKLTVADVADDGSTVASEGA